MNPNYLNKVAKINILIVNYAKYYIPAVILLILNCFLSHKIYITQLGSVELHSKYHQIQKFKKNKFVMSHLRQGESNVLQYLQKIMRKNKLTVVHAQVLDSNTLELELLCWHDKYLFDLLEQINSFSNGFIRLTSVIITKNKEFSLVVPNLKVKLIASLYTNLSY